MVENLIILSFDPFMCVYVQVRTRSVRVMQEKFPSSGRTSADAGLKLYFTKRSFVHKWMAHLHICPLRSWKYENVGCNLWRSVFFFLRLLICWPGTKLWVPAAFVRRGVMWDTLVSLSGMLQVDGFHCVILSLYTDPSHFWTSPRQELAHSLSVANGFLIESPQVVYLLVEVNRESCEQDTHLHRSPSPGLVISQQEYSRQYFNPSPACWGSCCETTLIWSF